MFDVTSDGQADNCDWRVAFATENVMALKKNVQANTFLPSSKILSYNFVPVSLVSRWQSRLH